MSLNSLQIEQYQRDGYLLLPNAVPRPVLAAMQQSTHDLIKQSASVSSNTDVYDIDKDHSPSRPRLNRIKTPHLVDPIFRQYLESPALLDLVRPLLGNSIRLHNSKLNTKAAAGGGPVEWHQDWAFYPHTNDDLLAVGVMLSDIEEQDGPLQVIPGTHVQPAYSHSVDGIFCGAVDPANLDLNQAVSLTGKAGDISLHHVRTLHGSAPNQGQDARLLLLYELSAADAWPIAGAQSAYTGLSQSELWNRFNENTLCGEQPLQARLANVPVMMPLPPPPDASSIFQVQASGKAISAFR